MTKSVDFACTLFEGDYHYGVATLANSLYKFGFRGTLYVGYKGSLPAWVKLDADGRQAAATGFILEFIKVETGWHLTNYKPQFMLNLLQGQASEAKNLAYFDPDIVVTCRWSFFRAWFSEGICVVQETTNGDMPSSHPLRLSWARQLKLLGEDVHNTLERYFNAGFISVRQEDKNFLLVWRNLLQEVLKNRSENAENFMVGDRTDPFYGTDQDCLNAALMATESPTSFIGPEGMGFVPGGFTMQHAVGSPKPWRFRLMQSLLGAQPPSSAIKAFLEHVEGPIASMRDTDFRILKSKIKIAAFVGRFYSRK